MFDSIKNRNAGVSVRQIICLDAALAIFVHIAAIAEYTYGSSYFALVYEVCLQILIGLDVAEIYRRVGPNL